MMDFSAEATAREKNRLVKRYDLWTYGGAGVGWWLEEAGYDNIGDAAGALTEVMGRPGVIGACIITTGMRP